MVAGRWCAAFGLVMKALFQPMIVALACGLASCVGRPGDGRESGSDKAEWSILQSLEMAHRGSPVHGFEFSETDGYHVICVAGDGIQNRVWIMMDPKSPPFYKQVPPGNYWLTTEEIESIRKKADPISTVLQALESHTKAK